MDRWNPKLREKRSARTRRSCAARRSIAEKVPSVEWLSVNRISKLYRSATCAMIGCNAAYNGSMFCSSLNTGTRMVISFFVSAMLLTDDNELCTQGQPRQPSFQRTQPGQRTRHEDDVVAPDYVQSRSGQVRSRFCRG